LPTPTPESDLEAELKQWNPEASPAPEGHREPGPAPEPELLYEPAPPTETADPATLESAPSTAPEAPPSPEDKRRGFLRRRK